MASDTLELSHFQLGVPSSQFTYRNASGQPTLIACRFDQTDGGKSFRPYDTARCAWKTPQTRPIYNLEKIAIADPETPIIIVEGEKCADALQGLGYLATTTFGGSNGFKKADLSPLSKRIVYIWPDLDAPGQKYAENLAKSLYIEYYSKVALYAVVSKVVVAGIPAVKTLDALNPSHKFEVSSWSSGAGSDGSFIARPTASSIS